MSKHDWYAYPGKPLWIIACRECGSAEPVRDPIVLKDIPNLIKRFNRRRDCKRARRLRRLT